MLCTHSYFLMEQSPSWGANSSSACWEIPSTLWILKVHYCTPNILPHVPVLIQINPDHVQSYFLNIHLILLYLLHLDLPSGLFPHQKPCTCPVNTDKPVTIPERLNKYSHLSYKSPKNVKRSSLDILLADIFFIKEHKEPVTKVITTKLTIIHHP